MNKFRCLALLSIIIVNNVAADELATVFFEKYVGLSRSYDPALAELYDDDAVVTFKQVRDAFEPRQITLSGAQLRMLMPSTMSAAKATEDRNSYSEINVSKVGENFKVSAVRYSEKKCYSDDSFYLILAPTKNNEFYIVEEFATAQQKSSCPND